MGVLFIILLIVSFLFYFRFIRKWKIPKTNSITFVNGGVKSGKSAFSLALALTEYKRACRKTKIYNFFKGKKDKMPMPLFYSNIPVTIPYVPLTRDLLLRKERFEYKSIIYIDEASLFADSQLIKDKDINNQLSLFVKLIAHETKGGKLFYNSQSICDMHYSFKRCTDKVLYIHHLIKWIPFVLVFYVREERYSEDLSVQNNYNEDIEDSMKPVVISKRVFKKYDCYSFSALTDNLKINNKVVNTKDLKTKNIVSFRDWLGVNKNEK